MKRTRIFSICSLVVAGLLLFACAAPAPQAAPLPAADEPVDIATQAPAQQEQTAIQTPPVPTAAPKETPQNAASIMPDGQGVVQFTVVLHLEGWEDDTNQTSFQRHAAALREYADLFERYGAKMTLEAKEIIDGCSNWGDNVLLEMQARGHAVGIHADAGGNKNASVKSIARTLDEMQEKLASLGIQTSAASGVASKADWVEACERAGIDTVSCMVVYGLWALDPALRPDGFEPYANPGEGHGPYPFEIEDRVHPWLMGEGSNWITHDPDGSVVIIPTGLSLNGASGEMNGEEEYQSDFTQADIDAWSEALPRVIAASDSAQVNTFYAVWSLGKTLDTDLLEQWLALIDSYVQAGQIRWSTIPEMALLYRNSLR